MENAKPIPGSNEPPKVNHTSAEVEEMQGNWKVVEALLGGTRAMRAAGATYLPKFPQEADDVYSRRLAASTLYPAFKRTVGVMVGKPFSKEMVLNEDAEPELAELCKDVDMEGQNLHNFALKVMTECLAFGFCGVLVDHTENPAVAAAKAAGRQPTQAEEAEYAVRPYFCLIRHQRFLGWKIKREHGVARLVQLRITDQRTEDNGPWGEKVIPQVRVLEPGKWQLWEKDQHGEYTVLYKEGVTTQKEIPFVPFYGTRTGIMTGQSPIIDLAHLNVKHWQSQSDQDNILHIARVPILVMIGANDDTTFAVGASAAVALPINSDMKFVEHTGAAIDAGEQSLYTLEHQMVMTGAELLLMKPGQRTATEANNDAEGNKCELQRLTEEFEASMDRCLKWLGQWKGMDPNTVKAKASLYKDFGAATLSDAAANIVLSMRASGDIDKRTLLEEMKRRGILSPDVDIETVIALAESEGPPLALAGKTNAPPAKK